MLHGLRQVSALVVSGTVFVAAALTPVLARAEPVPTAPSDRDAATSGAKPAFGGRRYSVRASSGAGGGSTGVAGRVGLAGEYWLGSRLGVGAVAARVGQSAGELLGPTRESTTLLAGPVLTLRERPGHMVLHGSVGGGVSRVERHETEGFCLWDCLPDRSFQYTGYGAFASAGWIFHGRGAFEIGPVIRFDVARDSGGRAPLETALTVNLELGFGGGRVE